MDDDHPRVFSGCRTYGKSQLRELQRVANEYVCQAQRSGQASMIIVDELHNLIETTLSAQKQEAQTMAKNQPHGPQKHRKGKTRRW